VRRFIWSTLVHRPGRTATLGVGILVAAVSFTLLTAAVKTSELQVRGTLSSTFRPAYDILVRPPGSFTPLERRDGLVRANYLSGIFGEISLGQWHTILGIPGVQVAAPIANVGYILPFAQVPVSIQHDLTTDPVQLYRLTQTWIASGGSRYPGPDLYVYYSRAHRFVVKEGLPAEVVPGQPRPVQVCAGANKATEGGLSSPFDIRDQSYLECFSASSPEATKANFGVTTPGFVGAGSDMYFPILLAAIDPVQENRLLNLDGTVTGGRPLREDEPASILRRTDRYGHAIGWRMVPVLASDRTYIGQRLDVEVQRLSIPPGTDVPRTLASRDALPFLRGLSGSVVQRRGIPPGAFYRSILQRSTRIPPLVQVLYWTASSPSYDALGPGRVAPVPVRNPPSIWRSPFYPQGFPAPPGNNDAQYRKLVPHPGSNQIVAGILNSPAIKVVGRFDPTKLPGFSPLSRVPLESYYPPLLQAADDASRRVLDDHPLLPTTDLGGYASQPPLMFTTLSAVKPFLDDRFFPGTSSEAPISVIRVRVAGVRGTDPLSLSRIKAVALAIHEQTGLAVDITAGSSPTSLLVDLGPGRFGQPPLRLREQWVKKGVAVVILQAVDRKSLALFVLVLVVCGAFLANGTLAAVRARRREIGTLLALGWTRARIFRAVLGEVGVLGVASGCVGAGLAAALARFLSLDLALIQTTLVVPVAAVLALAAGFLPAWRASRLAPLDAVRPVVVQRGEGRRVRRLAGMAWVELRRIPGRTLLASAALFLGIGALALLLAIDLAFRGEIAGTLLGAFVSVQVRAVDFIGVGLAVALAGLSVADVLYLNLRERAPELVTLRASGWTEGQLGRVVAYEGLGIGLLGSVAGAALGVGLAAAIGGGTVGGIAGAAGLAAACGVAVAMLASAIPAALISRAAPPGVLAEE